MRSVRVLVPAVLLAGAVLVAPQTSATTPTAVGPLIASVPSLVAASKVLGSVKGSQQLHLDLVLHRDDPSALDAAAKALTTPGSAGYHQFLSPTQFGTTYGARPDVVSRAAHVLEAEGVKVSIPSNHLMLQLTLSATKAQQLFDTRLTNLRAPGGRSFFANTTSAHLPASLVGLVDGVVGLDTANVRTPKLAGAAAPSPHSYTAVPSVYACPTGKTESGGGLLGEDLSAAYNTKVLNKLGYEGQGMTIALVEYADYVTGDAKAFESCEGISPDPLERRFVDGGAGSNPLDNAGNGEADLDIDVVMEMLPKISHVREYTAPNTDTSELDLYSAFATDDVAPVLSSSWGYCEDGLGEGYRDAYTAITEEAAVQGQQILDAAGDSGNMDCSASAKPVAGQVTAELQSADPYNTGVGGTQLVYPFPTQMESTWSGGGGAVSKYYAMPDYQKVVGAQGQTKANAEASCHAALCRTVPDVSADASPATGYAVYCSPCALLPSALVTIGQAGWAEIGGTSASTPLWSSVTLLMDQEAKAKGLGTIGFLNPLLYEVYADKTLYARDFFDVTSGSNGNAAGTGYDLATGLGTPNAGNLATDLIGLASKTVAVPSSQNAYGYVGGPATMHSFAVSTGLTHDSFDITSDASWLTWSYQGKPKPSTTPTIYPSPEGPKAITVTTTPGKLKAGTYTGHLKVQGSDGTTATYTVTYVLTPKAVLAVSPTTLAFSERVKGGGAQTCTSAWDDEFSDSGSQDPNSLRSIFVANKGGAGSVLHYTTELVTPTGSLWLNPDGLPAQTSAAPAVPTGGAVAAGKKLEVKLASGASFTLPALPPGTWTGQIIVRDLADPSKVTTVKATLKTGNGLKTPTIKGPQTFIVPANATTKINVPLIDSAHGCGYFYSAASDAKWVTIDDPDYAGEVAATGTPTLGKGLLPLVVNSKGLKPGTTTYVRVSSVQVSNQPFLIKVEVQPASSSVPPVIVPPKHSTPTPVTGTLPRTGGVAPWLALIVLLGLAAYRKVTVTRLD